MIAVNNLAPRYEKKYYNYMDGFPVTWRVWPHFLLPDYFASRHYTVSVMTLGAALLPLFMCDNEAASIRMLYWLNMKLTTTDTNQSHQHVLFHSTINI